MGSLADELSDPFLSGPSSHDSPQSSLFISPPSTAIPRRRSNMRNVSSSSHHSHGEGGGGGNRLSLAFELAAAMDPDEEGGGSDLLRELGLEEEEGIPEEGEVEEYEGEGLRDSQSWGDQRRGSEWEEADHLPGDADEDDRSMSSVGLPEHHHPNDGAVTPRGRSLRSSHLFDRSPLATGGSPNGVSEEDDEAAAELDFAEDTALLRANLESTDAFLARLGVSSSTGVSTLSAPTGKGAEDGEAAMDKLIGDVVKTMTEQTRCREAQTRELKEMEMQLAKTDRRILAELQALAPPSPTVAFSPAARNGLTGEASDEEQDEDGVEGAPTTPLAHRFMRPSRSGTLASPTSPTFNRTSLASPTTPTAWSPNPVESLGALRTLTASLVASLGTINEHTQVGRAAHGDAARRIKSVRGVVGNVKAEAEGVELCRMRVGEWEKRHEGKGSFKSEVTEASSAVQKLLEEAQQRAAVLLRPVA